MIPKSNDRSHMEDLLYIVNNKDESIQAVLNQLFTKYCVKYEDITREVRSEIAKKSLHEKVKHTVETQTTGLSSIKKLKNKRNVRA